MNKQASLELSSDKIVLLVTLDPADLEQLMEGQALRLDLDEGDKTCSQLVVHLIKSSFPNLSTY